MGYYEKMSDLELVGHVSAIPDASELSQALANRVRLLIKENSDLARKVEKLNKDLHNFELGIAHDKLDAYRDIVDALPTSPRPERQGYNGSR